MASWAESKWDSLAGQQVLVTGASGFIGSHLVKRLLELGSHVTVLLRPSSNAWRIRDVLDRVKVLPGDLGRLDPEERSSHLSKVQIVYHMAAAGVDPSERDAAVIVQTNVTGTLRALQLARLLEVDRFVYCGSCSEYTPGELLSEDSVSAPTSEYAASKSAGWLLTQAFSARYGLPVVSLRPFNVYGPFEAGYRLVPYTITSCLRSTDIELTGGEQARDFVFIDDVVEAFLSVAAVSEAVGGTFNVCTGKSTSIKEIVSTTVELTASAARPLFGAIPYRDTETWILSGDPARAEKHLGWTARTGLNEGLAKTIQWFRKHSDEYAEYTLLSR